MAASVAAAAQDAKVAILLGAPIPVRQVMDVKVLGAPAVSAATAGAGEGDAASLPPLRPAQVRTVLRLASRSLLTLDVGGDTDDADDCPDPPRNVESNACCEDRHAVIVD